MEPDKTLPITDILGPQLDECRQMMLQAQWTEASDRLNRIIVETRGTDLDSLLMGGEASRMRQEGRNYTAAETYFYQAATLAAQAGDDNRQLEAVTGLIDLARSVGSVFNRNPGYRPDEREPDGKLIALALERQGRAESIISRIPNPTPARAKAFNEFGLLAWERGQHQEALSHSDRALNDCVILLSKDPNNVNLQNLKQRIINSRGLPLEALGRLDEAIGNQQTAREGYQKLGDVRGEANALASLANLHEKKGDKQSAIDHHKQVMQITKDKDPEKYRLSEEAIQRLSSN